MKITKSVVVSVLATLTVCMGLLILAGILLIPAEIASPEQSVHENVSGIGYYDYPPSCGVLIVDSKDRGVFIYLDFKNIVTQVYVFGSSATQRAESLPYITHYTLMVEDDFAPRLCQRLGGIEITDGQGKKTLHFAPALQEIIKNNPGEEEILKISLAFFEKIQKIGLSSEDFMFIIEAAETNLSYSVCYDWISHIKVMFSNYIIN